MPDQKLLIIDDSTDVQELVAVWLIGEPVELTCCLSGEEGLGLAAKLRPDLILLDVDLPGLDGFETCRRLKAMPEIGETPIVFLTGASSTEQKLRGLEMGAIDYIIKPFDPAELRARVRSSLNTKRLMDLLEEKACVLQLSEEQSRLQADREQVRAEVLEMITQGQPLTGILRHLIDAVERQEPQAMAAAIMLNAGAFHHCAPHLPPTVCSSVERQLYALIARFNTLAAQSTDRLIRCDLLNDPAWETMRSVLGDEGIRICWAMMIRSRRREATGVFVLYLHDVKAPSMHAVAMLKLASSLVEVAVDHDQLNQQLTFQAQHDALTQLPNRSLFLNRLRHALVTSDRTLKAAAVLLVDVDRFKHVNDTYGHQAGDEMLCQVAHRLQRRLRACDTLARMGGDEFAVIVTDLSTPDDALAIADSLNKELTEPIELHGRRQFVTISIGAAVYPRDASDASTLLKNADLALYRAKDAGRNTARSFSPDMGQGSAERMEIEYELRQAVGHGELRLHYQPKVDPLGQICGVEALVRWQHPRLGMVPPMKFIPLAEDTGMIIPIGTWVVQEAARQARAWREIGLGVIPIAVNVSALQFAQADFISIVSGALALAGIPQPWLEIELTETLLMRNIREAGDKLAQLRSMQVSTAVDDFGTGYSSLAYLERLSLDALKIDHSFIANLVVAEGDETTPTRSPGRTIVMAIIALAKSLGLKVVAEGVETEPQRTFLATLRCDYLQGYLFSPPKPPDQIEKLLWTQLADSNIPLMRSA